MTEELFRSSSRGDPANSRPGPGKLLPLSSLPGGPVWLVFLLFLSGCAAPVVLASQTTTLTVLAAASLTQPFGEIAMQFEQAHPGVKVVYNFAGSQEIVQLLAGGAEADVFASADTRSMQAAVSAGRVDPAAPAVFARNRLVVIVPAHNPAGLSSFADLDKGGIKIALASSQVPAGQYTLDVLEKASQDPAYGSEFQHGVLKNVVSYENNVKAVLAKVALGEVDAGFVYLSDATGNSQVKQIPIPDNVNIIATYPVAAIKDSRMPALAQDFIAFLLSPDGQAALGKHGFLSK